MKTRRLSSKLAGNLVVGPILAMVALAVGVAWAQAPNAPAPVTPPTGAPDASSDGFSGMWLTALVLVGLLALVVGIGKLIDLRRKRQADAVHVQAQVTDALLREQALFGLPITPTAHPPAWGGSPTVLEISGEVPSPEVRETVLRIARAEAARVRPDVRIEDRMVVNAAHAVRAA
ncbi:MAG: hypothetical protein ACREMB_01965 [Candidatus Rokuibacteriota bacterium]